MRRSGGRHVVTLAVPDGAKRSDYVRDLRVGDLVQVSRRRSWTTVVGIDDWWITTQDRPSSPKKMYTRASIVDGARSTA